MNFDDLPEVVREQLSAILRKNPAELLPTEVELLKSRRDYLNSEQFDKFAKHLGALPRGKKNKPTFPTKPAGTQYKQPEPPAAPANTEPANPPAADQGAQTESTPPADPGSQQQSEATAPTHQELVDEATSLNLELDGTETDTQLSEGIADAKAEDLAKASELGLNVEGLSPVEIMNAIADKIQANATANASAEDQAAASSVGTEDVQNGQSDAENPYGGSNADPDQQ